MYFSNFTILVLISWILQSSLILASPVQSKAKRSTEEEICAGVFCDPGEECCPYKNDKVRCPTACSECAGDEQFSSGYDGVKCKSCTKCQENGMVQVEECTPGKDAVCECPHGKYKTNDDTCQPCGDICEGEECQTCNITTATSTPTTSEKSTTPAGTTGLSTASQTLMITSTSVPNIDKQKEGSSWKSIYLLPIIGAPLFVILVIGCLILCCWTKESHDFWADHFPCCCKKCQNPESEDGNKGNKRPANSVLSNLSGCCIFVHANDASMNANGDSEQQSLVNPNVKKQDDDKSVNLAVKQESAEGPIGCSDDLTVSYKREDERAQMGQNPSNADQSIQDENDKPVARTEIPEQKVLRNPNGRSIQHTNGRSSKGVRKVMRRRSSTSSLPDVPEGTPLSDDLPEWCKHDNTMVKCEDILDISRHIGKEVARIGVILGLTTGEVETIEHDHKFDLSRQNLVVLQEWKRMKGVLATKGVLAHALHKIGRGELAKKYLWPEQEWKQS